MIEMRMLEVTLRYSELLNDGRNVYSVLSHAGAEILKSKKKRYSTHPTITFLVSNNDELNKILFALNKQCHYEVSVVKVKHRNGRCYSCSRWNSCSHMKRQIFGLLPFTPRCYKTSWRLTMSGK